MTIFTEIENIIDKRPLTNVGDHFDQLETLTSNHSLLAKKSNIKISRYDENIRSRKYWKQVHAITKQF